MKQLIGKQVLDKDGAICTVIDATNTSVNILIKKKSDKGIDATNWFTEDGFKRRFSLVIKTVE